MKYRIKSICIEAIIFFFSVKEYNYFLIQKGGNANKYYIVRKKMKYDYTRRYSYEKQFQKIDSKGTDRIENGCKWRALPKKYGKWHTIYMRFNRWSKNGTIQRIFEEMQKLNIIDVRTDTLCIDSTNIKVHPDAASARKSNGEQSIGRSKGG